MAWRPTNEPPDPLFDKLRLLGKVCFFSAVFAVYFRLGSDKVGPVGLG